jgi:hypothetical protein
VRGVEFERRNASDVLETAGGPETNRCASPGSLRYRSRPVRPPQSGVPGRDLEAIAAAIIEPNLYMTLRTADGDGHPWVSPVYFAEDA